MPELNKIIVFVTVVWVAPLQPQLPAMMFRTVALSNMDKGKKEALP